MSTDTVTFYFDPVSPYVWLASKQLDAIAARRTVVWEPVLFAAMLNANGQKGPAEIPSKKAYTFRDADTVVESCLLANADEYPLG